MSTRASPSPAARADAPAAVPVRVAVTVLTGLRTAAVAEVAGGLLAVEPAVVLVRHRFLASGWSVVRPARQPPPG